MTSGDYIEVTLSLEPFSRENAEITEALLSDLPYESFIIDDPSEGAPLADLKAYIPKEKYDARLLRLALSELDFKISFLAKLIPQEDWNKSWESEFEPIVVEGKVTVRAPRHKGLPRTRFNLVIEPNNAFGTGHHETTFMVIQAMLRHEDEIRGQVVMDMGCGTGVLGILAAKMHAAHVYAIDISPQAAQSAYDNARINRVGKHIECYCGDASLLQAGKYGALLANIHRNIIITDLRTYARSLRRGGLLVCSGFYTSDSPAVIQEASLQGIELLESTSKENWACLTFRKAL